MTPLAAIAVLTAWGPLLMAGFAPGCAGPWAPRISLTERLAACCDEIQQAWVLSSAAEIFEFWANPKTSTWTILRSDNRGLACIAAAGAGWHPPPGKIIA
jgi:hypothetical protein